MSIEINIKSLQSAISDIKVSHIPCEIQHDGEANVAEYFDTTVRQIENSENNNKDEDSKCKFM